MYHFPPISPGKEPEQNPEDPEEQDSGDDGPVDVGSSEDEECVEVDGEEDVEECDEDGEGDVEECEEDGEGEEGETEKGEEGETEGWEEVEEGMREEIPSAQPEPPILDESQRENPWDALDDEEPMEEPAQSVKPTPKEVSQESLYDRIQEVEKKLSLAKKELTAKILDFVFGHSFSCLLFPRKVPTLR